MTYKLSISDSYSVKRCIPFISHPYPIDLPIQPMINPVEITMFSWLRHHFNLDFPLLSLCLHPIFYTCKVTIFLDFPHGFRPICCGEISIFFPINPWFSCHFGSTFHGLSGRRNVPVPPRRCSRLPRGRAHDDLQQPRDWWGPRGWIFHGFWQENHRKTIGKP